MAESLVSIWMSATISLSLTTLYNSIQFTFIICIMGSSPVLDFAGEIEINKIRSFTQRKDLVVKRLGSWGVWLLAEKANVCFLGPILRQSPRLYLTGFTCAQPVWNSFSEGRCCQSFSSLWLVMFFVSVHSWPRYLQSEVSLCVDLVWDLLQMPLRRSLYGWGRRREKP